MDGVNDELMEKLRKRFEVEGGADQKQIEERELDGLSRSLDSLKSEILLNRSAIEELKKQVARIQVPPPAEVRAEDLKAIDRKLDELSRSIESLSSDINFNRQSIDELKSHTVEIKTAFKPKAAEVREKEAGEEEMEERFVISPKTGVIEKVKGKKIDYIEAKPSTLKKEEKPKSKKGGIIEADDDTPADKGGSLFKRLKDIK